MIFFFSARAMAVGCAKRAAPALPEQSSLFFDPTHRPFLSEHRSCLFGRTFGFGSFSMAPQWTAAAALATARALAAWARAVNLPKAVALAAVFGAADTRSAFGRVLAHRQPRRVRAAAMTVLEHQASEANAELEPARRARAALCMRRLTAAVGRVERLWWWDDVPASQPPGVLSWVASSVSGAAVRRPPPEKGRLRTFLSSLKLERLGPLPIGAVICPERAIARVAAWRRANARSATATPPLALLRAVVYTRRLPTALASPGDHYWLVAVGRWAAPSEVAALFGVPRQSLLGRALASSQLLSACEKVACLGRSMHVGDAKRALRVLQARVALPTPLRYASLCSGLDTWATALDALLGPAAWSYVAAAETRSRVATFLADAYAPRGLLPERIAPDAAEYSTVAALPPADLVCAGLPCEGFSRRNHARSDASLASAARAISALCTYVRVHAPLAFVVENLDEIDARAEMTAALMGLRAYAWDSFPVDAADHGPMARRRRVWIGRRVP